MTSNPEGCRVALTCKAQDTQPPALISDENNRGGRIHDEAGSFQKWECHKLLH